MWHWVFSFVLGDTLPMDVASLHHEEEFIKYNVSLLAYGYYGDVLIDSENNRWMGPRRYDWAGKPRPCPLLCLKLVYFEI